MDDHIFRGAAAGSAMSVLDPVDPLIEFLDARVYRVGGRAYPPEYYHALVRYPANPMDVARMRAALAGIPRLEPADYDILLNGESREWDIVKWIGLPDCWGYVPGLGFTTEVVREPWPVYSIDARVRSPASLGDRDWMRLRAQCTTLRDPTRIDAEMREHNAGVQREGDGRLSDAERALAEYYHRMFRQVAEDLGIDRATPEQMARVLGGSPADYDLNRLLSEEPQGGR